MTIYISNNEPAGEKTIPWYLNEWKVPIEITDVKVGDFTWDEVCFERKTLSDLLHSFSGSTRLWDQVSDLKQFKYPFVLVIGSIEGLTFLGPQYYNEMRQILGAMAAVDISFFPVVTKWMPSEEVAANYIRAVYMAYEGKGRGLKPVRRKGAEDRPKEDMWFDVLTSTPSLGSKTASKLVENVIDKTKPFLHTLTPFSLDELFNNKHITKKQHHYLMEIWNRAGVLEKYKQIT